MKTSVHTFIGITDAQGIIVALVPDQLVTGPLVMLRYVRLASFVKRRIESHSSCIGKSYRSLPDGIILVSDFSGCYKPA